MRAMAALCDSGRTWVNRLVDAFATYTRDRRTAEARLAHARAELRDLDEAAHEMREARTWGNAVLAAEAPLDMEA